jgi:RNA ligase (TIGR02306 family)
MRKLASIRSCAAVLPIPGADAIQTAVIDGWTCVVKIGETAPGEKGVYFEIDSFLPVDDPRFEFLRKSSLRRMGDTEGFRLRTVRLRKQLSQGLFLPLSVFPEIDPAAPAGTDVTELLRIVKYEPPIPASLSGQMKGYFPSFIPKTDEERIQNLTEEYQRWQDKTFIVTEKLDGTSFTAYHYKGEFGVCSRNWELLPDETNTYFKVAAQNQLAEKLAGRNLAVQGELIGEGIQKNIYKLRGQALHIFHIYDIDRQAFMPFAEMVDFCAAHQWSLAPIVSTAFRLPATMAELLAMADGPSLLHEKAAREGWVLRTADRDVSFKVISNRFLEEDE